MLRAWFLDGGATERRLDHNGGNFMDKFIHLVSFKNWGLLEYQAIGHVL